MPDATPNPVICIGAGPAGLTAAYELSKSGRSVIVLEADPKYVGGISRTVEHNGFRFDIGGHRFFSKADDVEKLWEEILGDDLIERPRKSRILYGGQLYDYPLRAFDALSKLGIAEAVRCMASYGIASLFPVKEPKSFKDWVTNKFGARLFDIFFKTYTEKVWGMSCSDISADWAAQRIKGFSLRTAVLHAFFPPRQKASNKDSVKTLIKSFRYPRLGPGMMWDAARDQIMARGGQVLMDRKVVGLSYDAAGWTVTTLSADGQERRYTTDHVVSSAPLRDIIRALDPAAPADALAAADGLKYRDFITVALVVKDRHAFDDNWIYIHEPKVMVGRIQNFKSWSPEMVPDQDLNCLGLEYFCHEGDGLWSSTDAELVALATRELRSLGLVAIEDIISGSVVRQPKAYPVYDDGYQDRVNVIRNAVASRFPGLHLVGRNGMHRYNNQDHAMITALLTAKNILAGRQVFDPWQVNGDAEYHEDGHAGEGWNPVPEKRL